MTTQIVAHQKFIRQTPRKLRLVANMIRDSSLKQAINQLKFTPKRAAKTLLKVINQAKANAINNSKLDENNLKIKEIQIMEGPTYKRWQPVSRGRAHSILKRTSHIKITLEGQSPPKSTPKATKKKTSEVTIKNKNKKKKG